MGVPRGGGLSLGWAREVWGGESLAYDSLTAEASAIPAGAAGLLFLPYLQGERAPHLDPQARGAWIGLTAAHHRGHLVRAVLEGVAYSLKDCFALLSEQGVPLTQLRVTGGGARSALWRQICADVLEQPVATLAADEGPAFGAALIAGTAVGLYPSLTEACQRTVHIGEEVTPDMRRAEIYQGQYALYRTAYPAMRDLMHGLGRSSR